jgi:hypothetical protein
VRLPLAAALVSNRPPRQQPSAKTSTNKWRSESKRSARFQIVDALTDSSVRTDWPILYGMSTNVKIEVDERTAHVLQARAAELGVTVSELVAELATLDSDPVLVEPDEIVELDRRWKMIEAGTPTVPNERVVRWLRTWGTPGFRPWRAQ